MRLFFALWPPSETALALAKWAGKVQGRETAAAKIHLTLAFLGEAEPRSAIAAGNAVKAAPFNLSLDTGHYWSHNKIIWVGPRETPPKLQALVQSLHGELERRGFRLEDRPFAAHITLLRNAPPPKSVPKLPALPWPVREFLLIRSVNGVYERVETFQLGRV